MICQTFLLFLLFKHVKINEAFLGWYRVYFVLLSNFLHISSWEIGANTFFLHRRSQQILLLWHAGCLMDKQQQQKVWTKDVQIERPWIKEYANLWTQKSKCKISASIWKPLWNIWFKNTPCTRNIKSFLKKILGRIFTLSPRLCSYCTEQMQIKCLLFQLSDIFCSNFIKLLFLKTVPNKIDVWLRSYC